MDERVIYDDDVVDSNTARTVRIAKLRYREGKRKKEYSSRTRVEREPWSGTQGSWGSDTKSVALFAHDGLVVAPQLCDKWLWKEMCVTVRAIKRREREKEKRERRERERERKRQIERQSKHERERERE